MTKMNRENVPSSEESYVSRAKTVCSEFLPGNWIKAEAINVTIAKGGVINKIYRCRLPDELCDEDSKPHEVIVRLLTYKNSSTTTGESGEAIAFNTVAEARLGPKLLGVFYGGRIEEFIDGRLLHVHDLQDENVLKVVARKLAAFHSLIIPLAKEEDDNYDRVRNYMRQSIEQGKELDFSSYSGEIRQQLSDLLDYDYEKELDWVLETKKSIKIRKVTSHSDFYANNILIRKRADGKIAEDDVVLIDLECIRLDEPRGVDIGQIINEANYDFTDMERPMVCQPISEELQRHFVREYIEAWKELNPSKFDADLDTEANVMLEQKLLALITTLSYCAGNFAALYDGELAVNEEIMRYIVVRKNLYEDSKRWVMETLN